jgi:CheY-like chemotaxis protein
MKTILLVDDDPLILMLYRAGFARAEFVVEVADGGLAAIAALRNHKPDLVVLDLMMPAFTGVDVLKFIRGDPDLASVPVVVLSNSYMNSLAQQAESIGVQMALLKASSSPSTLAGIIRNLLEGRPATFDPSQLLAIPSVEGRRTPGGETLPAFSAQTEDAGASPQDSLAGQPTQAGRAASEFQSRTCRDFLASAASSRADLNKLWSSLLAAHNDTERYLQLSNLYRKLHFLAATAGFAHCANVALLSGAFEAMVFEVLARPALLTSSALSTAAAAVDFLGELLEQNPGEGADFSLAGHVLVVDDDAVSNRLVVAAVQRANLLARSAEDPLVALQMLRESHFDLLLLDIEMPEMSGFEFCKLVRTLDGYHKTPVVFATRHDDFDSRKQATLSGGDDLIGKPFFPLELAVKAVTHLLRSRLGNLPAAR